MQLEFNAKTLGSKAAKLGTRNTKLRGWETGPPTGASKQPGRGQNYLCASATWRLCVKRFLNRPVLAPIFKATLANRQGCPTKQGAVSRLTPSAPPLQI